MFRDIEILIVSFLQDFNIEITLYFHFRTKLNIFLSQENYGVSLWLL